MFELSEARLTALGEDPFHRHVRGADHEVVGVDERSAEALRALGADSRLARTHQADQDEVLVGHRSTVHRSDARYAS